MLFLVYIAAPSPFNNWIARANVFKCSLHVWSNLLEVCVSATEYVYYYDNLNFRLSFRSFAQLNGTECTSTSTSTRTGTGTRKFIKYWSRLSFLIIYIFLRKISQKFFRMLIANCFVFSFRVTHGTVPTTTNFKFFSQVDVDEFAGNLLERDGFRLALC